MQSSYFKSALTWLPELLLRLVLVLSGWGATHLGAFFANRARAALIAAFLLSFVLGTAFRIEFNPFRNTGGKKQGTMRNTGSPSGDRRMDQLAARERKAGLTGMAERLVVLTKPGNSGGGKGPQLKADARSDEGKGDWR